ncbi:hypothetical protein PHYBLDRAFT_175662 [Phycomyces blakesleeanus NRRL 1555(-)]|uniref:Uncharacterized protein n=1 Tax=Phycomyces blakesleeanus (strain ATCC 8743b / DSM 1359 / FGSC 10004 / NBRC 33097 / NRRL 1555) TaxID=763407 RepID=A0A163CVN0_PHYB8|nr:hypothetical protein PHYBLDRAFT_175662 [Phycomyces blakesleeanus NRRL 1555(-)]OAD65920.1 hypothetical protein PHYBLDRAFT_175662 [Phycomyces blakesleeanus NRRL 1555(-)]|eukprot:XP_018283960.1 hypothetical protein PHYBLDRAFT_175662 [Phycomyces blakesleeanus NRRL 1555(-)]
MSNKWQKIINAFNVVASDNKSLQYDACWYKVHFDENERTSLSGINQYRSPIEKVKKIVKNELKKLMQTRSSARWEQKQQLNKEERGKSINMVTHNRDVTVESKDSTMEDSTVSVSDDEHEVIYDVYMDKKTQFCQKMLGSLSLKKKYQKKMLWYASEQKKSNARIEKMMKKLVKALTDKK